MLQMTRHINADWKNHVGATGVTCYTCHRGQPVPANIWFTDPGPRDGAGRRATAQARTIRRRGRADVAALRSVHAVPRPAQRRSASIVDHRAARGQPAVDQADRVDLLADDAHVARRSASTARSATTAARSRRGTTARRSVPPRSHGIQMVRDLNDELPRPAASRLSARSGSGPIGDAPKANCATCHQGVYKPLYGAPMAKDYPELCRRRRRWPRRRPRRRPPIRRRPSPSSRSTS